MKYPHGIRRSITQKQSSGSNGHISYQNRGMTLEEDIHVTNQFYIATNQAIIHKKPTPIQIVKVDYPKRSAAVIKEGYFKAKSTTDFNGIYKGKYIDFEAKETKNKTLFPLANIHDHQFDHLEQITHHGGIGFVIIRFVVHNETYLLPAERLIRYRTAMLDGGKKSVSYKDLQKEGYFIPFKYQARVDYLSVIDQLYF